MPLRDLLKKKDRLSKDGPAVAASSPPPPPPAAHDPPPAAPEFTFMRTDTHTQEIIQPPTFPGDFSTPTAQSPPPPHLSAKPKDADNNAKRSSRSRFRSASSASVASTGSATSSHGGGERKLRERLHLRSHSGASSRSSVSVNVPSDLPSIDDDDIAGPIGAGAGKEEKEAKWEERATILARGNPLNTGLAGRKGSVGGGGEEGVKDNIQEAIRLHEEGDIERSTAMFGRLADPSGANDPLSQVLYGLALRHGWGIPPDPSLAVTYLSAAASNSAAIESSALASGLKKGGTAKGELVLAIFELANSFQHGWGVGKDPVAAKRYYETAANLGDTDAMNEVARCYLEGIGGKKDKYTAAKYYRLAEQNGNKTLGNSWIWKEKYNPK